MPCGTSASSCAGSFFNEEILFGAGGRIRTLRLLITFQLLCPLSYAGTFRVPPRTDRLFSIPSQRLFLPQVKDLSADSVCDFHNGLWQCILDAHVQFKPDCKSPFYR